MMAGLASSGLWLIVILAGAINGYPTKKALESLGASSTNPFSSSREEPGPGYAYAESAFPTAPKQAVLLHTDEQPRNIHPSAQMRPVPALYDHNVYPAPVNQRFDGDLPVGSTQPTFQYPPNQVQWAVDPPPFSSKTSPHGEPRFVSRSPGYMSPPGPFPPFQPVDASYEERTYEQGDSESEEEGPPAQYLPVLPLNELTIGSPLALATLVDRLRHGYPLMEYMLLSRRYPPGTYTLSTNQLDHRRNQWNDSRHIGDPYRSSRKQLETISYPYGKKHPIRPVKKSIGHAGYDNLKPKPHGRTSGGAPSPDDLEFASEPSGFESMNPPNPFLPEFQPGRMSYVEKVYEHGNYNSESEGKGAPHRRIKALNKFHGGRPLRAVQPVVGLWFGYPQYYLLLPPTSGLRGWSSSLFLRG